MRTACALAVLAVAVSPHQAFAADAAAALKKLEAARTALTEAVKRIEKDPPSNADLDAAHAAVEALKVAVDAGAEFEAKDLDYAKSSLAARKELRSQRDYVDQRRANVKIFDARRAIDPLIAALNDAAKKTEDKSAAAKDFEDARAATQTLKKALDEARPFGKADPKFGQFLTETDALIAKHQKAFDERGLKILVEKSRGELVEKHKALTAAIAALTKDAPDTQFKAADAAANALGKHLDDSKDFEAKDSGYRGDAQNARKDLAAAKKRMDDYVTETGLNRLKGEIEPAYKDLSAALKMLRGKPTEEQLAEAKTAAIVVRKLVEKFQPEAARSQAFGKYVEEVGRTLADVDGELAKRSLATVKADAVAALKAVEKRDVKDEQFAELNTALTVLEKTLDASPKKDPVLAPLLNDGRTFVKDAKATMAKRRLEVDVQKQQAKVEEAKKLATEAIKAIQVPKFGPELVTAAESAVTLIGTVLDEGKELKKKDGGYAKFDGDTRKKMTELREKIAQRKVTLASNNARDTLNAAVVDTRAKIDVAKAPAATDPDLDAAIKSFETLGKLLEDQLPIEKTDKGYTAFADRVRGETYKLLDTLELAKVGRELKRATADSLTDGNKANEEAAAAGDLRSKKSKFDKAASQFRSCERDGNRTLARIQSVANKIQVLADGQPVPARDAIALCVKRAEAAEQQVKDLVPLIAFDEGPKKAYEAAKTLAGKGNKSDAITQYTECVTSGVILNNRSPEMKEKKLAVGGTSLTLPELIAKCQADRKSLGGK